MFAWMKGCMMVLLVGLLAVACVQQGDKDNTSKTEDASGVSSDSSLKVSIYYVGDAKCRTHLEGEGVAEEQIVKVLQANNDAEYMKDGKNTHRLDGDNAGLINKEYKDKKDIPIFGGEKFLKDNDIARTLATLENNCRRVLLSIDADETPSIDSNNLYHTSGNFTEGSDGVENFWKQRFDADFGDFGGNITCGSDKQAELKSLCHFAQINAGKRYFLPLYPKAGENSLAAEVTYKRKSKELTEKITIEKIALNELQLPTTKLSDIVVNADCGEDNSCLFDSKPNAHKFECQVEGKDCGQGFTFIAQRTGCNVAACAQDTANATRDRLCTGAATVAALSEHEINLKCALSWHDAVTPQHSSLPQRINASHLAGRLCVVTTTLDDGYEKVDSLVINASACEREPSGKLKGYMLELSFAPAE